MLTLKQIEKQIKTFQDTYGVDLLSAEQGSTAWLQSRLGVITSSCIGDAVAKVGTKTRNTYMCTLVAEVASGMIEEINTKYMDWGKMHEPAARASYEFKNDCKIEQVGFVFKDDTYREGSSLDGIIVGKSKGAEIKCPYNTTNYIKFLLNDDVKKEWALQCQHQMRVTGMDEIDIIQFDPRMEVSPLHVLSFERDPKTQAMFDELIPAFISDTDEMLKQVGIEFGAQWTRLAVNAKTSDIGCL